MTTIVCRMEDFVNSNKNQKVNGAFFDERVISLHSESHSIRKLMPKPWQRKQRILLVKILQKLKKEIILYLLRFFKDFATL